MKYACTKCKKKFPEAKATITRAAEYPGARAWDYISCPYCGAGEGLLDEEEGI